jgi:hypothetical protein
LPEIFAKSKSGVLREYRLAALGEGQGAQLTITTTLHNQNLSKIVFHELYIKGELSIEKVFA